MQTKNFVGAINNFIEVTQLYRFSKQLPEAYFRLTEIYYKIGLESEALESFKILKINYIIFIYIKTKSLQFFFQNFELRI